jgi:Skp family chaperone for outer membrane proteins
MNRTLAVVSALGAGLATFVFTGSASAQAAAAPAPATSAAAALALQPPQAIPAKIALIFFEQAVGATNEGQKASADLAKEVDPLKVKLTTEAAEVDALKKKISSAPATMTDAERTELLRQEDTKEKQFSLEEQDANASVQSKLQEIFNKLAPKVATVAQDYCEKNGFTIMLDAGAQQGNIMWVTQTANIDITKAVIDAYNASSGVAAPPPPAPSAAAKPRSSTTPTTPTTPHPAASKPATTTK